MGIWGEIEQEKQRIKAEREQSRKTVATSSLLKNPSSSKQGPGAIGATTFPKRDTIRVTSSQADEQAAARRQQEHAELKAELALYDLDKPAERDDREQPKRTRLKIKRPLLNKSAVEWLADHRTTLKAAGWTPQELYRANRSQGIVFLSLWKKDSLKVSLDGSTGKIVFRFDNATGDPISQAATPQAFLRRKYQKQNKREKGNTKNNSITRRMKRKTYLSGAK